MLDPVTQIEFPFYQSDVEDMFGEPDEGPWAEQYMKNVDLTMYADKFAHVTDCDGNLWNHKIYANYAMEGPLQQAFKNIVERGLASQIHTYDGCFCIRKAKGGNFSSMHSWGLAIDLDAARNPFREDSHLVTTFTQAFVRCFADAGFEWGGSWSSPKDAMHFQLPWIKERSGIYAPVPFKRDTAVAGIPSPGIDAIYNPPQEQSALASNEIVTKDESAQTQD